MSTPQTVAFLFGLFGFPVVLVAVGHGFRHLSPRARRAFWGGIVGYTAGLLGWWWAAMIPAVHWADGTARFTAVILLPALGGLAGLAAGALAGRGE